MANSRIPEVIDALVAGLTTAVTPVLVLDGPVVTGDSNFKVVGISWDGDDQGDMAAVLDWEQAQAAMGDVQDETFSIPGYVTSWNGDEVTHKVRRDEVFTILDQVEDWVSANPSLGLAGIDCEFATGQLFQLKWQAGTQARLTFTILVRAL